jgi:hypothetical protein
MASWSRALDLSGQIWGALWLVLTAGVHCDVLSMVGRMAASISVNKGWPPSYSILLHQRSTGWSMWCFFILFLRWEEEDELHRSSSFFKRFYSPPYALQFCSLLLAGLGGEGEVGSRFVQACGGGWIGELLESVLPGAISQRRLLSAAAISGQKADLASLGSSSCTSLLFHLRKISSHPGVASPARALPSGRVPGESRSGRRWSCFVVGELGSDRFSSDFIRVCSAKFMDYAVIFFFCKVLDVTLHPPTK